jgi:23S rRNA (cytidine1920-2'-O)/16S rRNA (cytidine1409-2'-O)-methyltransferase
MRVDQLIVERGLAASRAQAQRLIVGGARWRVGVGDWKTIVKNRDEVPSHAELELLDASEARYVSRGGLKLEGALATTGLCVAGARCLDVGQSTGGFTDCLLQHGAARVVGVDVGQGQLHSRMRADERVVCIEQVNARHLDVSDFAINFAIDLIAENADVARATGIFDINNPENNPDNNSQFDPQFEVIVGDLSFISMTLVLPALVPFLAEDGAVLMLVKPQFELQPGQVGKGGIVRDAALYAVVEQRVRDCCKAQGLQVQAWLDSPISGGDGNREFFVFAKRTP